MVSTSRHFLELYRVFFLCSFVVILIHLKNLQLPNPLLFPWGFPQQIGYLHLLHLFSCSSSVLYSLRISIKMSVSKMQVLRQNSVIKFRQKHLKLIEILTKGKKRLVNKTVIKYSRTIFVKVRWHQTFHRLRIKTVRIYN